MGRATVVTLSVAAVVAGLGVAGCSTGPEESPVSIVSAAPSPTATTSEPDAAWENAVLFTRAVHEEEYESAAGLVSPGSPADRYVTHQANVLRAQRAAGFGDLPQSVPVVTPDRASGTVQIDVAEGPTYSWSEFVADESGLIVAWTGATGPVEDVLWTTASSSAALGQTLTLASAYRSNTGSMWIVLDVFAEQTSQADLGAVYVDPDGVAHSPVDWYAPNTLVGGATSKVVFAYEDAGFGGTLVYQAIAADYSDDAEISLNIG